MFANGWPGTGLLLLRLVTGAALIHYDSANLRDAAQFVPIISQIIGAGAGILLLVGLWTPVAGAMVAIVEVWIGLTRPGDLWIPTMLAVIGATLATVGPGAWSIDARLFGRKHIDLAELDD